MEYLFEDFIFGFIEKEIESVTAKAQRSDTYLDEAKTFNLKPDLFLKTQEKSLRRLPTLAVCDCWNNRRVLVILLF